MLASLERSIIDSGFPAIMRRHDWSLLMLLWLLAASLCLPASVLGNVAIEEPREEPREEPSEWHVVSLDDGIQTSTQTVEGSPYKAARHVVEIDAGVNNVLMAFGDGSSCVAWLVVCKQSRIIERISEYEYVGYAVIDMPWPVANRDLVFRSTVAHKALGGAVELTQVAEPLAYPSTKLVRMLSRATYLIEPLDENRSRLTYTIHTDPGGNLSSAMVNAKVHVNTRRDVSALIKHLQEG
jgi:hypothetical protein